MYYFVLSVLFEGAMRAAGRGAAAVCVPHSGGRGQAARRMH
ncbi:hypothetical protein BSFP_048510 [Burkholderia stabilis]|uniref:Uncharacterized protein n=1 Tax=Burkholderia stabilis TaxID=95485 RepID=A0A1Y1BQ66_9BURK|nr:hypothetical protein BSFP_048510 [Burkholderia stabilis]